MAELAREVWRNRELAERLDREAEELRRFNETFWIEERNGYYALALDAQGNKVDSLCSNIGHLLWSDRAPGTRRCDRRPPDGRCALVGLGRPDDVLGRPRVQPSAYHNGTIWPHDNSLIAWGLARYGRGRRLSGSSGRC